MAPRVHVANFHTLHQRPLAGLKTVMLRFSVAALKLPYYFCSVPVRSVMGAVFGSIESGLGPRYFFTGTKTLLQSTSTAMASGSNAFHFRHIPSRNFFRLCEAKPPFQE